MPNRMPLPTKLSRPMVSPKLYKYPVKKIELLEAETGKNILQKKIQYITVDPIEAKYFILLSSLEQAYPLPLRNVLDVKVISTNTVEFDFWGTKDPGVTDVGTIGFKDKKYILRIKTDEKYTPNFPELLKELKALENNSEYWKCELLTFPGNKTIEVYSQTPFLADGEQIIWQNPKSEFIDNKKQVIALEVVTNFRVFEYDYIQHRGSVILFSFLEDVKVTNQQHTMATSSVGSYSDFSYKITGIKNIRTNSVVGDTIFYVQGKPLITFEGITDPEMLSTAVMTLKKQYDTSPGTKQQTERIGTEFHSAVNNICSKCNNNNPVDSKFCNGCGSALSLSSILFDNSEHVENRVVQNSELDKIERYRDLVQRVAEYKPAWDKNGVIQYKTEYIAILQRMWGSQVEFIIAFDDLTKEGYRLIAIDEGKTGGDSSDVFTGGVNSYFYFQKMKYVGH
jgi:hypothetical protein